MILAPVGASRHGPALSRGPAVRCYHATMSTVLSRKLRLRGAVFALVALGSIATAFAQTSSDRPPPPAFRPYDPATEPAVRGQSELRRGLESLQQGGNPFPDVVKRVGSGLFQLGTVKLDLNARQVRVPGRINMVRGIIEYLAVMDGRGKLHESVLALDAEPSLLQLALILLGMEPGELAPGDRVTGSPPRLVKSGDPVTLWVEWEQDGRSERVLADTLIFNRETQKPLDDNVWNFSGSFFVQSRFAADVTGSIVATRLDYRAMLNASQQIGNPYRGANLGYEVNTAAVPAVNTPVQLVFEPGRRAKEK